MVAIIVILSIVVPILEVLIFAGIVANAGIWAVIIPSIVTSAMGLAILIRHFPRFMRASINSDRTSTFPTMQSYYDATRLVSGVLLFIPGFITDLAGLILLMPRFRGLSFAVLSKLVSTRKDRLVMVGDTDEEKAAR